MFWDKNNTREGFVENNLEGLVKDETVGRYFQDLGSDEYETRKDILRNSLDKAYDLKRGQDNKRGFLGRYLPTLLRIGALAGLGLGGWMAYDQLANGLELTTHYLYPATLGVLSGAGADVVEGASRKEQIEGHKAKIGFWSGLYKLAGRFIPPIGLLDIYLSGRRFKKAQHKNLLDYTKSEFVREMREDRRRVLPRRETRDPRYYDEGRKAA